MSASEEQKDFFISYTRADEAWALWIASELAGAEEWTQRALAVLLRVYGPANPSTKKAQRNLDAVRSQKR